MTTQPPITPPPELVQQWFADWDSTQNDNCYRDYESHIYVATRAAHAVLHAWSDVLGWGGYPPPAEFKAIAAALRAAAPFMEFVQDHLKLIAIATELEGAND